MSSQFKHRLIGTIVLVALLVIILPDIIDGHKEDVKEQFSTIPFAPKPADEKPLMLDLSKSSSAHKHADQVALKTDNSLASGPAKATSTRDNVESKKADAAVGGNGASHSQSFTGNGWIIQLATLKSADSAQRLIEKLHNAGYQVHSYPQDPVDGQLNRIFVGPELSKEAMEKKVGKLKELTGLKGFVRHFDPLDK